MLFLTGLALALIVGFIAGGRVGRLGGIRLAWFWVAPVALVAQALAVYGPSPFSDDLAVLLIVASHAALIALALTNLRAAGMILAAVGLVLNLVVIVSNGGYMPITPETVQMAGRQAGRIGDGSPGTRVAHSKDIIIARPDTWFEPLADRYWTGLPGRLGVIFSVGDAVLLLGFCTLVVRTMTSPGSGSLQLSERGAS